VSGEPRRGGWRKIMVKNGIKRTNRVTQKKRSLRGIIQSGQRLWSVWGGSGEDTFLTGAEIFHGNKRRLNRGYGEKKVIRKGRSALNPASVKPRGTKGEILGTFGWQH